MQWLRGLNLSLLITEHFRPQGFLRPPCILRYVLIIDVIIHGIFCPFSITGTLEHVLICGKSGLFAAISQVTSGQKAYLDPRVVLLIAKYVANLLRWSPICYMDKRGCSVSRRCQRCGTCHYEMLPLRRLSIRPRVAYLEQRTAAHYPL